MPALLRLAPSPIPATDRAGPDAAFRCSNSASLSLAPVTPCSPADLMLADVPTLRTNAASGLLQAHCPATHPPAGTVLATGSGPPTMAATSAGVIRPHASNAAGDSTGIAEAVAEAAVVVAGTPLLALDDADVDGPSEGEHPASPRNDTNNSAITNGRSVRMPPVTERSVPLPPAGVAGDLVTRLRPRRPSRRSGASEDHAVDAVGSIACHSDESSRPVLFRTGHIVERPGHHRLPDAKADRIQGRVLIDDRVEALG